jgi:hypothetical protein
LKHLEAEVQGDFIEVLEVNLRHNSFEFGESGFEIG